MDSESKYTYLTKRINSKEKIDTLKKYMYFGWEENERSLDKCLLSLKRESRISKINELNQLQREWEKSVKNLSHLEEKARFTPLRISSLFLTMAVLTLATAIAFIIIGLPKSPLLFLGIALLPIALLAIVVIFPIYRHFKKKKLWEFSPLIDKEKAKEEDILQQADNVLKEAVRRERL